ncbi:MAG TPA: nitrilase-related carbon-nitrogen hydrolase [Verrucomicrobiae bacterium]
MAEAGPSVLSDVEPESAPGKRRIVHDLPPKPPQTSLGSLFAWTFIAAFAFHLAWAFPRLNALIFIYAYALLHLSPGPSARCSVRLGLLTGLLIFGPLLSWFWRIFGPTAIGLWLVLSFFTAAFVLLLHFWRRQFGPKLIWLIAPMLWTGLEYFRSELYYLKFSWFSVGYVFSGANGLLPIHWLGVYGTGFLIFFVAALISRRNQSFALLSSITLVLGIATNISLPKTPQTTPHPTSSNTVQIAGVQLEFPPDLEVPHHLDRVISAHPAAQIIVLSEYTFDGPVPEHIKRWCRQNNRYLIAGGKEEFRLNDKPAFANTAFVISPRGEVVFQQGKSVPIQFFNDGIAATEQNLWHSPWGKIAIPICYDLSYRRVIDRFVAAGAQAIIVPFMDVTDWGKLQHKQHARIAPLRAAEYSIPIFRLGSSGISQHINSHGTVLAQTTFPGEAELLAGSLEIARPGKIPFDRWLAPFCSGIVAAIIIILASIRLRSIK